MFVASRLRRGDARTGWLIAVGGAFATTAVAFSYAKGIFHPLPVGVLAAVALALKIPRRARAVALVEMLGAMALAPAT